MAGQRRRAPDTNRTVGVYVISVAADLTGLHPQTLRTYERLGLITPGRTGGGGRRYSMADIDLLRQIAELTADGIGIQGVRRILDLERKVAELAAENTRLTEELERTRAAVDNPPQRARPAPSKPDRLPVLRPQESSGHVVVWRRGRG